MKKILVTVSDEAYAILKQYKETEGISNLDSALDEILKKWGVIKGNG